jgi:hypothetical protein
MIPVVKAAMDIEDFDEENVDIKGYYKNFFIRTFWAYPILFFLSGTESIITRSLAIIVLLSVIFVEIYFQKVRKKGVMKILENPKPESLKEAKNPVELDKNELKIKNFYNYFFSIGLIFIVSGAVQVRKNFEEEIENTIKTAHENERFSVKVKSSVKNDEIDNKDFYDCFREVVRNNEDFEDMLSITVLLDKRKCNKGKEDYYDDTFKNCVIKKFRYLCFESVPSGTSEIKFNMEFKYSAK